jgi:hypothetical protein
MLVCCLDDVGGKPVASPILRRKGSLWNYRLVSFATAIVFFAFTVSKGASINPSVDKSTNKRFRYVAVAQTCAIVGAPWGNIRDLVAVSEEGAEMAQDDSGDQASVADGSTEVPLKLVSHGYALAATAASLGTAVMGAADSCLCCQCGFGGIC